MLEQEKLPKWNTTGAQQSAVLGGKRAHNTTNLVLMRKQQRGKARLMGSSGTQDDAKSYTDEEWSRDGELVELTKEYIKLECA